LIHLKNMGRLNDLILGSSVNNEFKKANILLIGVGGIGCEVLKVICKFPFNELHILDLDTIEVSNLNRQFLFRKEHRGKFKAHTARETLLSQYPDLKIFAHNKDIRSAEYGVKFFKKFDIAIMALDNA
jgi:ubiquitin-like 1-activating enzyme E1 B